MPVLPFTELFEQAKLEVGDRATDTDTENYYKSLVNIVYTNLLPQVREWKAFVTTFDDPIQVIGNYNTGTVDITSGSATVTGTNTVWTSAMVGRKFIVQGDDEVYIVDSFSTTTSITLNRTYNGSTVDDGNYEILDDLIDQVMTLKLYSNNKTPSVADIAVDYTEVSGGGYLAKSLLTANWIVTEGNPSNVTYNTFQDFFFTGPTAAPTTIYGYYIIDPAGILRWAERFTSVPFIPINGALISIKPKITCRSQV